MNNEYKDYLKDILRSMQLTQEFTLNLSFADFDKDEKTQYAVIRCIEVIGEAVKRLPEELRVNHSDIPWKAMAGMRDRLIHGYDVVDNEIVWNTIKMTIPKLIDGIEKLINTI